MTAVHLPEASRTPEGVAWDAFSASTPELALRDLREDGRFALHAHQDPAAPSEVLLRGRAVEVDGPLREAAAAAWSFGIDDGVVFDLRIDQVTLGERPDADAWPPVYRTWRRSA